MKETRAIILIFSGDEPDEHVIAEISQKLYAMCGAENVDPYTLDQKDLVLSAIKSLKSVPLVKECKEDTSCKTPEDNAALFIGVKMKNQLGADYTPHFFIAALMNAINAARKRPNNQANKQFMNALFILSQPDLNLSKDILTEFNLDADKIAIIRDTYNLMKSHE